MSQIKQNIILVLQESIKFGKQSQFQYPQMNASHMRCNTITTKMIDEKVSLFNNLDEQSYTFKSILQSAKQSLSELRRVNRYNEFCAELILRFMWLEFVFVNKNLKSVGVRINDNKKTKVISQQQHQQDFNVDQLPHAPQQIEIHQTEDAIIVGENVNGKELMKRVNETREFREAMQQMNFDNE